MNIRDTSTLLQRLAFPFFSRGLKGLFVGLMLLIGVVSILFKDAFLFAMLAILIYFCFFMTTRRFAPSQMQIDANDTQEAMNILDATPQLRRTGGEAWIWDRLGVEPGPSELLERVVLDTGPPPVLLARRDYLIEIRKKLLGARKDF